ncbi:putative maltose O-acetyltransferase [Rhypophila decipiens]|uniref:Maltose O-acetyltransferase n=1 Tax=Rhypophila decipiens TaxID=261697 RepID=A0AAN6Y8L1_9PEZI|nr:putative maltose O-acetyltransferase [Rhypophila decipiens]
MATFTALNGGSPKATEDVNGTTQESDRGAQQPSSTEARAPTQQRERESWSATSRERLPYPVQTSNYADGDSSHKRKRALSDSPRREQQPSPPERPEPYGPHRPHSESRDRYGTPQRERERERDSYRGYGDESRDGGDNWRGQSREERNSSYEGPYSAGPVSAQSDEPMGDSHRRAASQGDSGDYGNGSPDGDDMYSGQYTPEQRRDGVIQSDPKKRKRNFSNRTKTGCLTCRKRKKKCDEAKPECSNCIKGGFVCAGYPPQRGTWPKPESKPAQVNIESKDPNYVPPGAYGMPQQQPPHNGPPLVGQQQKRDPFPYNRGQPSLRITPPQGRPLQSDDDRPTASTLPSASVVSPDNKLSALSGYTTSASVNMFPTPVSAASATLFDRTPKEYQRVPPLHDLSRTEPDHQQPQSAASHPPSTTLPQPPYSVLHPSRNNTPPNVQTPLSAQPPQSSGAQATAQLALSHTQFPTERPRREKEEMLHGRPYYPFDKELVLERERCNAACWRFNNSTNPNIGVSPAERARLFRDILHPREGVHLSPTVMSPVTHTGRVGENAVVEAPFNCDYGYNIQIGNNVSIGRNCLINDVCEVRIGNNVIISPNVCIYTGTCSTDPRRRAGNSGTQYGKGVIIEDDVWIAANVIILPGVRIGRGSTVGAGSVVTKDVATYSVYMGLKAGHRRGIAYV